MSYDANGNTLSDGTNTYAWDARNRLSSANSGAASFSYDALGRRASKTLLSTTTGFLYDGPNVAQEQSGGTVTANMLSGSVDENFLRTDCTGSYAYLTDALGSTVALTDSTGTNIDQYSYSPYGMLAASGSNSNPYTYTGRESDGLGIYYYRARYYNPTTGRFISEDPLGFAGGVNVYAYAGDDPGYFRDPYGLLAETGFEGFGGGSFGGGGAGAGGPDWDTLDPVVMHDYIVVKCKSHDAPNSVTPKQKRCAGEALSKNAVALGLDVAGVGAGFLPGGDLVVAGAQMGVNAASTVNSAVHGDTIGAMTSIFGFQVSAMVPAAKFAGVGTEAIPGIGTVISAFGALNDAYGTYQDYQSCMAGH